MPLSDEERAAYRTLRDHYARKLIQLAGSLEQIDTPPPVFVHTCMQIVDYVDQAESWSEAGNLFLKLAQQHMQEQQAVDYDRAKTN